MSNVKSAEQAVNVVRGYFSETEASVRRCASILYAFPGNPPEGVPVEVEADSYRKLVGRVSFACVALLDLADALHEMSVNPKGEDDGKNEEIVDE